MPRLEPEDAERPLAAEAVLEADAREEPDEVDAVEMAGDAGAEAERCAIGRWPQTMAREKEAKRDGKELWCQQQDNGDYRMYVRAMRNSQGEQEITDGLSRNRSERQEQARWRRRGIEKREERGACARGWWEGETLCERARVDNDDTSASHKSSLTPTQSHSLTPALSRFDLCSSI